MPYSIINKMDTSINWKSKPLHSTNIWINNIGDEINDPHPTIPITNTINFEHYDLWSNFVINYVMDQTKNVFFRKWKLYLNTPMCLFFIKGARTSKNFMLKLIIQILLRLYNGYVFF